MPTRFTFLQSMASMDSSARQPVPAQFALQGEPSTSSHAEDAGWEYFEWLHSESKKCYESFIQQILDAVNELNAATWPKDLGLPPQLYPFTLWRGTGRANVIQAPSDVALGEILEYVQDRSQVKKQRTSMGISPHHQHSVEVARRYSFVTALKRNSIVVQPAGMPGTVQG